jgi:membrane-bound serine protease (ClpP class)
MKRLLLLLLGVLLAFAAPPNVWADVGPGTILAVRVADTINPAQAQFITEQLSRANAQNARAFLVELDTPGGLDTAMRQIIQGILASEVPVIVYVYPSGARAASAGAFIMLASDFAVMAPGTNVGAASPVAIGAGDADDVSMEKVMRDAVAYARSLAEQRGRNEDWAESIVREAVSTPARQALELGVIDLIAESEEELLLGLDGAVYERRGEELTLSTEGAIIVFAEMNLRQQILNVISNPNVAYMLLMLGILGIFFEISNPGAIFPGAIGAIALLLAFFGLQTLPVNYVGLLLILVAVVLFVLEISVASYGMLSIGGLIALTLGSLMLIDSDASPYFQISRAVIAAMVGVSGAFIGLVLFFVVRTQGARFFSGQEGMVGERGTAVTDVHTQGTVFVHGEYWEAYAREQISRGEGVEVVKMEGLKLEVRRAENSQL